MGNDRFFISPLGTGRIFCQRSATFHDENLRYTSVCPGVCRAYNPEMTIEWMIKNGWVEVEGAAYRARRLSLQVQAQEADHKRREYVADNFNVLNHKNGKPEPKHEANWVEDLYHDRRAAALRTGKGYPNPDDHTDSVMMTARVNTPELRKHILNRMGYIEHCCGVHPDYANEYKEMTGARSCIKYVRDEVETKWFHEAMGSRRREKIINYLECLFATKVGPLPVIGQYGGGRFTDNTNFFRGYLDPSGWFPICTWDGWMYDRVYRKHFVDVHPEGHEEIKEGPTPVGEIVDGMINIIRGVNAVRNAVKPLVGPSESRDE